MSAIHEIAVSTALNTGDTERCANRLPGIEEITFEDVGAERTPRDKAALLLSVGAEIEHALMVQYLYAAYSVRQDQGNHELRGKARGLAQRMVQIAREEMGHLITVQNLLLMIGAPVHFARQHSPFASLFYPFRFKLEPLSSGALAKYVTAESPVVRPPDMDDDTWAQLCAIARQAQAANDGRPVRHVGQLYERLIALFSDPDEGLQDADFGLQSDARQARYQHWGFNPGSTPRDNARRVQVDSFEATSVAEQRGLAVESLRRLSEQGEGFGAGVDSHFERFLALYNEFEALTAGGVDLVWPVATNPSVVSVPAPKDWETCSLAEAAPLAFSAAGYISAPRTRGWANLFNMRYRLLIACLAHFLDTEDGLYVETPGRTLGDPTARGLLLIWAFDEMRRVKKIAEKLTQLPLADPDDGRRAGAPFQLPYTLSLAQREPDRWRSQLDIVRSALNLVTGLRKSDTGPDRTDPFLEHLQQADVSRERILMALAAGRPIPAAELPTEFSKVVHILEQAVRGFAINVHGNFWSGQTREQFVNRHIFNHPLFQRDSGDECRIGASNSYLLRILRGRMPAYRPPIDAVRHRFIGEWVDRQAPDNVPKDRPGIESEPAPSPEPIVAPLETVAAVPAELSYAAHIRPMFRDFDRTFLKRLDDVDVDDAASVRGHADSLLDRLQRGEIPYDANWSHKHVERFRHWLAGGAVD